MNRPVSMIILMMLAACYRALRARRQTPRFWPLGRTHSSSFCMRPISAIHKSSSSTGTTFEIAGTCGGAGSGRGRFQRLRHLAIHYKGNIDTVEIGRGRRAQKLSRSELSQGCP